MLRKNFEDFDGVISRPPQQPRKTCARTRGVKPVLFLYGLDSTPGQGVASRRFFRSSRQHGCYAGTHSIAARWFRNVLREGMSGKDGQGSNDFLGEHGAAQIIRARQ